MPPVWISDARRGAGHSATVDNFATSGVVEEAMLRRETAHLWRDGVCRMPSRHECAVSRESVPRGRPRAEKGSRGIHRRGWGKIEDGAGGCRGQRGAGNGTGSGGQDAPLVC